MKDGIGEFGAALLVGSLPDHVFQPRHASATHDDDLDIPGLQQALRSSLQLLLDDDGVDAVMVIRRVEPGGLDAGEPGTAAAAHAQEGRHAVGEMVLPELTRGDDAPGPAGTEQGDGGKHAGFEDTGHGGGGMGPGLGLGPGLEL